MCFFPSFSLLPSGKRLHNYGKIHHFLMGKLAISTGPFSIAMLNYQRVSGRLGCIAPVSDIPTFWRQFCIIFVSTNTPTAVICLGWGRCGDATLLTNTHVIHSQGGVEYRLVDSATSEYQETLSTTPQILILVLDNSSNYSCTKSMNSSNINYTNYTTQNETLVFWPWICSFGMKILREIDLGKSWMSWG